MLGNQVWESSHQTTRARILGWSPAPGPLPVRELGGRRMATPTATEKALKPMRSGLFPQRRREPQRSERRPPHPPRALPSPTPAGSAWPRGLTRALSPPDGERNGKLASGSPPSLVSSRPHASSHLPAPHEEQDASSG